MKLLSSEKFAHRTHARLKVSMAGNELSTDPRSNVVRYRQNARWQAKSAAIVRETHRTTRHGEHRDEATSRLLPMKWGVRATQYRRRIVRCRHWSAADSAGARWRRRAVVLTGATATWRPVFTTTDRGRSNSRRSGRAGHVVYGLAVVLAFPPTRRRASRPYSRARVRRVRVRSSRLRQQRALLRRRTEWRVLDTSRRHQMVESPAEPRSSVPSAPSNITGIVSTVSTADRC